MADKDLKRLEKKEERDIRRQAKSDIKDYQLGRDVAAEASRFGVDLSKPTDIGPLTQQRKEQIDKDILGAIDDSRKGTMQTIQSLYKAPSQPEMPQLSEEALKRSMRREKRARILDAISAIGQGMQGRDIDTSRFLSSQLRGEREAQYSKYRQAQQAARKGAADWEEGYRNKMIGYLEDQLKQDPAMSDAKRREIEARINKLNIEAEWKRKQPYYKPSSQRTSQQPGYKDEFYLKGSNPYTSVLYSISDDPESLFPALQDGTYSPTQKEDAAKQIILQMYDIKTDERGNQYLMPKEGKEGYLSQVRSDVETQRKVAPINEQIAQRQQQADLIKKKLDEAWGIEWYDKAQYRKQLERLQGEISDLESQRQEITGKSNPKPSRNQEAKTTLEDIYSKYR